MVTHHFWPGNAISIKTKDPVKPGEWVHVAVTNDGSSSARGLQIYINGKPTSTEIRYDHLTRAIKGGGNPHIRLGERMRDRGFKEGLIDEFRVFGSKLSDQEISNLLFPIHRKPSNRNWLEILPTKLHLRNCKPLAQHIIALRNPFLKSWS